MAATLLLRAFGLDEEEILGSFYESVSYKKFKKGWLTSVIGENHLNAKFDYNILSPKGKIVLEEENKVTPKILKKIKEDKLKDILVPDKALI